MINRESFIKFLNYIGIINEQHQAKLYKKYQRFYCKSLNGKRNKNKVNMNYKNYRVSDYRYFMTFLGYDEIVQDKIIFYLTKSQYRLSMDKEIKRYSGFGVWGKECLNYEMVS
jgi:hypothetical protein